MAYVDAIDDKIVVRTEFRERDLIRQVPGARWDPVAKVWTTPLSWGACQTLRGVFKDDLQIGPALTAWAQGEYTNRVEPARRLRSVVEYSEDTDPKLYAFQQPGRDFLCVQNEALLADEMGTGKTVQVIAAASKLHALGHEVFPVLCVVPSSTKIPWSEHWEKWAPGVEHIVVAGSAAKRTKQLEAASKLAEEGKPVAVMIGWEAVRLHSKLAPYGSIALKRCVNHGGKDVTVKVRQCESHPKELNDIPWRTIVVDEAHKMKDPKAKQTRAVWAVQHGPTVRRRWSLTGTPIGNHPGDLWSIMHGVSPGDYPSKTRYVDRYTLMSWNAFGGLDIVGVSPVNTIEYFNILDPHMRRMPKSLVLSFLPSKVRERRYAEMSTKQARAYKEIANGSATRLDDGGVILTTNALSHNLRLLQFASSYAEVSDDGSVHLQEPSSKLDALDEIIADSGGKPIVVCAESKQLIDMAAARLEKQKLNYRLIVGGQTEEQRNWALKDFQEGRAQVLLFTIKAGGVGLTMTRADTIVFLQRSWSMVENKQAEDRVHRIGAEAHSSVTIIDIVAPDTVEENQIAKLYEKLSRLEEIVRDRETLRAAGRVAEAEALDSEEQLILSTDLWTELYTNKEEMA